MQPTGRLEPIDPRTAYELYLDERRPEVADTTYYAHSSRLGHFLRWCDEQGIDNLNDLTGRSLHEYRVWRREDGDLAKPTLKTQMATLRVFIRWCENIDAVPPDLHQKVVSPTLGPEENVRDVMLDSETAVQVLGYLSKYEYASGRHAAVALLWHTGMRRGSLRSLDLGDFNPDEQYLATVHRPDTGTPLKNGKRGERMIALSDGMCELLGDWVTDRRPDRQDEYDRDPLFTTTHGRISLQTVQKYVYSVTRPCFYTGKCPHNRDIETCEANQQKNSASMCPSSVSPHAIRRGSITHWLTRDVPPLAVGERANVSQDVLGKHYDRRTDREKMEQRRQYLGNI